MDVVNPGIILGCPKFRVVVHLAPGPWSNPHILDSKNAITCVFGGGAHEIDASS